VADADAQAYGVGPQSETDRQSFPLSEYDGSGPYNQVGCTDGLGDYRSLSAVMPPQVAPRAADVFGANNPSMGNVSPEPQPPYLGGMA
jgi:hypothetical protein